MLTAQRGSGARSATLQKVFPDDLDHASGIYDYVDSQEWHQRIFARPGDHLTLDESEELAIQGVLRAVIRRMKE